MKKTTPLLLLFVGITVLCAASYYRGYRNGTQKTVEKIIVQHDTTIRVDTIGHPYPVYITKRVVDTIPYPVVINNTDTMYVPLPKEERTYGDSTFFARISGIEPSLDYIEVYQRTEYINNTVYISQKDQRKNYLEFSARVLYDKGPFLPVTASLGREMGPLDIYVSGGYDILNNSPVGEIGTKLQIKWH